MGVERLLRLQDACHWPSHGMQKAIFYPSYWRRAASYAAGPAADLAACDGCGRIGQPSLREDREAAAGWSLACLCPFLPCHESPMLHAAMMFPMSSGTLSPRGHY